MPWDEGREPVRAADHDESRRLAEAARSGPYVAWRDEEGRLRTHALGPRTPATIGRSEDGTILTDHPHISREHAEVTVRMHGAPPATGVHLLDYSEHGTEHRRVVLRPDGTGQDAGPWRQAPRWPARAHRLDEGTHDVRLGGERCLLVGGVPRTHAGATDPEQTLLAPTVRQARVLVELCRPFSQDADAPVAPPTNAQIALALDLTEERVRALIGEMYTRYHPTGSSGPRMALVELARHHRLVDA